jgi:predicted protein tyrosine phosphatase
LIQVFGGPEDTGRDLASVEIAITDRSGAGKILCSPSRCAEFRYAVSIGVPPERPPAGWRNAPRRLRLEFEDSLLETEGGPSGQDVDRLIRFAQDVQATPGGILLHCQAGISRSTAAAAIILAVVLGHGREAEALCEVYRVQPEARPNTRMIELADAALGRNGALMQAAELAADRGRQTER